MALTPMSVPARMPSALSVVTMASTWGQPHAGPTVLTNRASAGRTAVSGQSLTSTLGSVSPVSVVFLLGVCPHPHWRDIL